LSEHAKVLLSAAGRTAGKDPDVRATAGPARQAFLQIGGWSLVKEARMPLEIQTAVLNLVSQALGMPVETGRTPDWLMRPGKTECRGRWPLVCTIYLELTGGELPEEMPRNNRRQLDGILQSAGSRPRIVEVDESQHFKCYRGKTLRLYPAELQLAFDRQIWIDHSQDEPKQKAGFAAPKPPLFPNPGGRHLQRAFRDALADILPVDHGYLPTLRIADFEVKPWIRSADARSRMEDLLKRKISH
jgi:hypothetical protein